MNISLNNTEIEEALVYYIKSQGVDLSDKTINVTLIAGRGANGHSANIAIEPVVSAPVTFASEPSDAAGIDFQK